MTTMIHLLLITFVRIHYFIKQIKWFINHTQVISLLKFVINFRNLLWYFLIIVKGFIINWIVK
jgi:hypothetical protein